MLDYLKDRHRYWYDELQKDLRWLLDHVDQVDVRKTYQDVQLVIQEKSLTDGEAPTISAGTLRQISMLTAYYALMETEHYKLPGLIVIEEPDTSVHPLLLGRFVDLLRSYTDRDEPRQFILTTHNPRLLDWFEPGEVRVVERDEQGYTSVRPVSKEVADIWLKEHTLGDAWLTRSLGGAPK